MRLKTILIGVGLSVVLAGCGGGGGNKETPPKSEAEIMHQLSACYRQHGAPNYPDPVQQPNGGWAVSGDASEPPKAALDACASIEAQLPQQANDKHEMPAAEMTKLRQFAQCMRGKGLADWPDPNNDGTFPLPTRLRDKQVYLTQLHDCQQFLSDGRLRVSDQ
jgi:hypothetical protein